MKCKEGAMQIKYDLQIENEIIISNLKRLVNQIYKLLPTREEFGEWQKPLSTIIVELAGMSDLFLDHHGIFFTILCKLEGLFSLKQDEDFFIFRKTIFECLGLMNDLVKICH